MAKFKKYGYPLFMGASGILTTVSDLIQKNEIAVILSIFLAVVGVIAIVTPLNLQQKVLRAVVDGVDESFSSRAFGSSCLLLAVAVFGFSTLSVKAAPEGGIIASQYPEVQQMQVKLGVIEQATARIEGKTDQLLTATRQWISITGLHIWNNNPKQVHLSIENNTPFFFKNITGTIKTSDHNVFTFNNIGIGADGFFYDNYDNGQSSPSSMTLCVIGVRTSDGAVIKEVRNYIQGREDGTKENYLLEKVDGPTITNAADTCDA